MKASGKITNWAPWPAASANNLSALARVREYRRRWCKPGRRWHGRWLRKSRQPCPPRRRWSMRWYYRHSFNLVVMRISSFRCTDLQGIKKHPLMQIKYLEEIRKPLKRKSIHSGLINFKSGSIFPIKIGIPTGTIFGLHIINWEHWLFTVSHLSYGLRFLHWFDLLTSSWGLESSCVGFFMVVSGMFPLPSLRNYTDNLSKNV